MGRGLEDTPAAKAGMAACIDLVIVAVACFGSYWLGAYPGFGAIASSNDTSTRIMTLRMWFVDFCPNRRYLFSVQFY